MAPPPMQGPSERGGSSASDATVRDITDERGTAALPQNTVGATERMLRLIAHDLRNPLAVIQGYAELSRRQLTAGDPRGGRIAERLEKIAANARRMARQLGGMVDAAALRAGRSLDLQLQTLDLRDLLRSLGEEYRACYTDLQLETRLPDEALIGDYDAARIGAAFASLLDTTVRQAAPGTPIRLEAQRRDEMVEVTLDGPGIDIDMAEEDRGPLLDPHSPTEGAEEFAGLGLGLAGAAAVVAQHGGEIRTHGAAGGSTSVTVSLPLAES